MSSERDPWEDFDAADRAYTERQQAADAAKEELFDACAAMVQRGYSAEAVADRNKANKKPGEEVAGLTFTATYLRRKVRERGVARLRSGPKKS